MVTSCYFSTDLDGDCRNNQPRSLGFQFHYLVTPAVDGQKTQSFPNATSFPRQKDSENHLKTLIGPKSRTIMIQNHPVKVSREITALTSEAGGPLNQGYPFFKVVITMLTKQSKNIHQIDFNTQKMPV